jgi:hypothetical protein
MREAWRITRGNPEKRCVNVLKCWRDNNVVGEERRAQRYFRLAEAYIAADQPVHRSSGAKVVHNLIDGALLVVCLLIRETRSELAIDTGGRAHHRRAAHLPLGRQSYQLPRHFQQAALQLRLARLPRPAAELVKRRLRGVGAIARQQLDVLDRQEQAVVAGIVDFQTIMRRAERLDRLQTNEAAYAVLRMDDDIACGQRRSFGDEIGGAFALGAAHEAVAKDILLGNDDELIRLEPGF